MAHYIYITVCLRANIHIYYSAITLELHVLKPIANYSVHPIRVSKGLVGISCIYSNTRIQNVCMHFARCDIRSSVCVPSSCQPF